MSKTSQKILLSGLIILALSIVLPFYGVAIPSPLPASSALSITLLPDNTYLVVSAQWTYHTLTVGDELTFQAETWVTSDPQGSLSQATPAIGNVIFYLDNVVIGTSGTTAFWNTAVTQTITWNATLGNHTMRASYSGVEGIAIDDSVTFTITNVPIPPPPPVEENPVQYVNYMTFAGVAFVIASFFVDRRKKT